jgi:hypothetical protein
MAPLWFIAASVLILLASANGEKLSGGTFSLDGGITSGGGVSEGGSFRVLGEVARPVSGQSQGGSFVLQTDPFGAYSILLGEFELEISQRGSTVILNWPAEAAAYTLEATTALGPNAVWQAVPEAAGRNSISIQAQGAAQFFRLHAAGN